MNLIQVWTLYLELCLYYMDKNVFVILLKQRMINHKQNMNVFSSCTVKMMQVALSNVDISPKKWREYAVKCQWLLYLFNLNVLWCSIELL